MWYTYLLIDFFTIIIPFLFSFHPRLQFHKTWKAFFPAVLITGLVFVLWDIYFTQIGVWGFNPDYLTGLKVANLPLEELLFFLCIPYSCVFTFHCLLILIKAEVPASAERFLTPLFIVFLFFGALVAHHKIYTFVTFLTLSTLLAIARYILKVWWLSKFYVIYAILLIPFLIVNGLLTGTGLDEPVVWYHPDGILGPRILTIPVEDIFYGMALFLMNLLIYMHLNAPANAGPTRRY